MEKTEHAAGGILAHSLVCGKERFRKGKLLDEKDVSKLIRYGYDHVAVARLEDHDTEENLAATRVAENIHFIAEPENFKKSTAFTGRVNIFARSTGIVIFDEESLIKANAIDNMITIATVPNYSQVSKGFIVATVKIISYGVMTLKLEKVASLVTGTIRLKKPKYSSAHLITTKISRGTSDKALSAIKKRTDILGLSFTVNKDIPHNEGNLKEAIDDSTSDVILILTASATSDISDVAPMAVKSLGGNILRFGIPVDPGNLLFLGMLYDKPIIGLPGCAKSPAINGADWVISRVVCGHIPGEREFASMGVGGLLKENNSRPMPRLKSETQN
tara:strand:+ start:347 stop:1339 length:993 start_codon:yes stop_codon:yes gene_type:complete